MKALARGERQTRNCLDYPDINVYNLNSQPRPRVVQTPHEVLR